MSTIARMTGGTGARRWLTPRVVGIAAAVVLVAAIALDTSYQKGSVKANAGGRPAFDPASYGRKTYPRVVAALTKAAVPLPQLLTAIRRDPAAAGRRYGHREGSSSPYAFATRGEGVAGKARDGLMPVRVAGVPKRVRVSMQVGPALNGTAVRDAAGFIHFGQFVNQVDYADAGTALNNRVKAEVLAGADAKRLAGKRIDFVGAFTSITPDVVTITPVKLEAAR